MKTSSPLATRVVPQRLLGASPACPCGEQTVDVIVIRPATAHDGTFLSQMLAIAADWRPDTPTRSVEEVLADPDLAHYVVGWPLERDVGVVAEDGSRPIGAAWWRFFTSQDPAYGFIDERTPEVAIGVVADARGRGVGRRLLQALIAEATAQSLPALSLSVEPDNPAVSLYRSLGFVAVEGADAQTMRLELDH